MQGEGSAGKSKRMAAAAAAGGACRAAASGGGGAARVASGQAPLPLRSASCSPRALDGQALSGGPPPPVVCSHDAGQVCLLTQRKLIVRGAWWRSLRPRTRNDLCMGPTLSIR